MRARLPFWMAVLLILALAGCQTAAAPQAVTPWEGGELPWAGRGLSGRLILIRYGAEGNAVVTLDLASGDRRLIFQAPKNSALFSAQASPDGQTLLLDYAPPPPPGAASTGATDIYLMPLDGSRPPRPLLERTRPNESYYFSTWTPDGKAALASHYFLEDSQDGTPAQYRYRVERISLDGSAQILAENALRPRLAPGGDPRLAYLSIDLATDANLLYLSGADGPARSLVAPEAFPTVDAFTFTPDGAAIVFSAVNPISTAAAEPLAWLDRLLGVRAARAHNLPSDWYRVELATGALQRLTSLSDSGLFGAFSPDGGQFAFIGYAGLYLMNPDGSQLIRLGPLEYIGTVDWVK